MNNNQIIPSIFAPSLLYAEKEYRFCNRNGVVVTYSIEQGWNAKKRLVTEYMVFAYEPERLCGDFAYDEDGNLMQVVGIVYCGSDPTKAIQCFSALREYWK